MKLFTSTNPERDIRNAFITTLAFGILSVVVSLAIFIFVEERSEDLETMAGSAFVFGLLFLGLSWLIKRRSKIALIITIILLILDSILSLSSFSGGGLILRLGCLWFLIKGFNALRKTV